MSIFFAASCNTAGVMLRHTLECNEQYSMLGEEDRNFTVGWVLGENHVPAISRVNKTFVYHSSFKLKGLPYYGKRQLYGGGGYVADLGTSQRQASQLVDDLLKHDWIDLYTRAVFLEYTVYNPNINLFAFVNFLMEFPATGSVMPYPRVTSFHVYSGLGAIGTVLIIAQLIFTCVIIYFIVHEALRFRKQRKEYFNDPWNYLEVAIIVTSIVAIVMHVMRELIGRLVMSELRKDKGN